MPTTARRPPIFFVGWILLFAGIGLLLSQQRYLAPYSATPQMTTTTSTTEERPLPIHESVKNKEINTTRMLFNSTSLFPKAAIFLNGNPDDPRFMWTYSFSRFLRRTLPSTTSVYATQARKNNLWAVQSQPQLDFYHQLDPVADMKSVTTKSVLPRVGLIFSRNHEMSYLVEKYTNLFRFCTNQNATCPVVIHFPIGQAPCQDCSPHWYQVVPDSDHVKALSQFVWKMMDQIQKGHLPDSLSQSRYQELISKNCTLAYVSSWKSSKGQFRFAQDLETLSKTKERNITLCFAGKLTSSKIVEDTEQVLTNTPGVTYHTLGVLNLAEQILVLQQAQRSVLWTSFDFSPRVVYLALASGARTLTTTAAGVALPVHGDCLATIVNLTTSSDQRLQALSEFLDRDCSDQASSALSILHEDHFYGPIVQQAVERWKLLNNGTIDCRDHFVETCQAYKNTRQWKRKGKD